MIDELSPGRGKQPCLWIVGAALLGPYRQCRCEGLRQGIFRGCNIPEPRRQVRDQLAAAAKSDSLRCRIGFIVFWGIHHGDLLRTQRAFLSLRGGSILSSSVTLTVSPGTFPIAFRIPAFTGSL